MTRTLDLANAADAAARTTAPAAAAPAASAGRRRHPCREVCACAFEYLDGELAPALATAVRSHLAACGGCRRRVAGDRALLEVVARAARAHEDAAPPSLRARIHRALTLAELERAGARRDPSPPPAPQKSSPRPADRSRRRA